MDINRNNMNELFTSFNMLFAKGLANAPHEYEKYSTIITSSTASTVYPYLEQFGRMREWIGDRQKRNIASGKIEVFNRDFEDTVVVPRNDIEDDQYALYGTLIQMLGQNAAQLWEILLSKLFWAVMKKSGQMNCLSSRQDVNMGRTA